MKTKLVKAVENRNEQLLANKQLKQILVREANSLWDQLQYCGIENVGQS